MFEDTIAAIATPPGEGGIGIIRISGDESISIADKIFKSIKDGKKLANVKSHTVHFGHIIDGENVDPEKMHVASAYLLDLDDTEMRLAKYLLLYAQIQVDISEMNTAEVLLLLNELNRTIRVGHYFLSKVEDVAVPMVQYRATVMAPEGEHFDGAIVADTILEMGVGYDIVKEALMQANEECKRREGK